MANSEGESIRSFGLFLSYNRKKNYEIRIFTAEYIYIF